jgi:nucleoid DNA-binding protein
MINSFIMFLTRSSSLLPSVLRRPSNGARSFFAATPTTSTAQRDGISKREIIQEIADTHDLSVAKSERILNTVLDTIVETVAEDRPVRLRGFGSFEAYNSLARMGRNPITGETIQIEAKKRIRFKAYDSFKKTTNGE